MIILRPNNPLPVIPREQEGFYSCWSASAEMIMDFHGRHVRQCEQASRSGDTAYFCCDDVHSLTHHPDCDEAGYPDFERWGFSCHEQFQQSLNWPQVVDEIDGGRPFAFSWTKNDPTVAGDQISHMLVVVGYSESGGPSTRLLFCLNPRPFAVADEIVVTFAEYSGVSANVPNAATAPGGAGHTHQSDYFGIEPVH